MPTPSDLIAATVHDILVFGDRQPLVELEGILRNFGLRLLEESVPEERRTPYDNIACPKCGLVSHTRTSHHSEEGYSQCCGKKLVRVQGDSADYDDWNACRSQTLENGKKLLGV